ncbi:MAG: dynamin family protein [Oscillospiraceae bacterium]|nr:dynamin family protein [Oscillospiraceae bacterium]
MKVMQQDMFSQVFLQTMYSLENCQPLLDKVEETLKQKSAVVRKRVAEHNNENAPFRVAFCGVFSAGKSTLINALLKCEYELPTGTTPITKVVTRIRYGPELSCFYYHDNRRVTLDKQQSKLVIRGESPLPKGCTTVHVEMPADILRGNVEFIDTPGFDDEKGGELEHMSRRAITDADMAVLCCNSGRLGVITEKNLINELESASGNFCMVLTRADNLNTEEGEEDVRQSARGFMQGRGNLAMLPGSTGKFFMTMCNKNNIWLDGFDSYLKNILKNPEKRKAIRNSTDMLSMIAVVAALSRLSDETAHEIDLSSVRGAMPQQELQEDFVSGMLKMMETASNYCPQCGRAMMKEQTICPSCGRVHQIKVRAMNQETMDKLSQISQFVSHDNSDYSICWDLEARKIAKVIEKTKRLTAVAKIPGVTEMLQSDLERLYDHCKNAEFQIAIVGVMKAGKSMLMNALMGTEIASVDINPETASLTKFRSADRFYIRVYFHNKEEWNKLCESAQKSTSKKLSGLLSTPEVKQLSGKWLGHAPLEKRCATVEELRGQVEHWTSARSYDHLFASEVEVGIDRSVFDMPDEVVFVDTPGLHDPVQYRSDITKAYVKKANAVLIAVPTKALTTEGLESITTALDYVGSNKEKAYIVATQKDQNNNRECEKVIKGWAEHLVDAKRYTDEEEARRHILITSGKMHLLVEKFTRLDEETLAAEIEQLESGEAEASAHFESEDIGNLEAYAKSTLKKFLRYDVFSLREKPEDAKALIEDSGIPALRECLSRNLLSRYKELLMRDIRDEFIRCRSEMRRIVREVKKTNEDILLSSHKGTEELKKKLDESSKAYEIAKVKNKEIREAAEAVRAFNLQLIESL